MSYELNHQQQRMSDELFKQVHKNMSFQNRRQAGSGIAKYRSSLRAFCNFAAKEYRMRNLRNISNKHLAAFAEHRQNQNIIDVKTELSAVRKFHSTLEKPRYQQLETDNSKLGIEERKTIKDGQNIVDRAWTDKEFHDAVEVAREYGHEDIANAFELARFSGMRINEVTAFSKSQIRKALETNMLTVTHTKGGFKRTIDVNNQLRKKLHEVYRNAQNERIFISHGRTHEQAKKRITNFIQNHREKWSNVHSDNINEVDNDRFRVRKNLSFHGLRHSFAREQYRINLAGGMSERQARKDVAEKMGHGRDEVTKVYL